MQGKIGKPSEIASDLGFCAELHRCFSCERPRITDRVCLSFPTRVKDSEAMITGEEIRRARQRAGWSQGELAQRVGTSQRTVGNWERGDTSPSQREGSVRQALEGYLDDDRASSVSLSSASDVELLGEIARRLGRAHTRQEEEVVGNARSTAPITQAGEDSPAHDELAARRTPHRKRRTGHDPEWDGMYGNKEAAHFGIPGEEIGQDYTDSP